MKRLVLIMAFLTLSAFTSNRLRAEVNEGNKPFVPTRLEWMEMYLNAGKGVVYSEELGYGISYLADSDTDTLFVVVFINPEKVNRKEMEAASDSARRLASSYARKKGWANWLKIEMRNQQIAPQKPKVEEPARRDKR